MPLLPTPGLGAVREIPDVRDYRYQPSLLLQAAGIPVSATTRAWQPEVFNQGQIGACVFNNVARLAKFVRTKNRQYPILNFSRLYGYYKGREKLGTVEYDSGMTNRDAFKILAAGVPSESVWPYNGASFYSNPRVRQKPTPVVEQLALKYHALVYYSVPIDLDAMRDCIAEGYPFIVGLEIYQQIFNARLGAIATPKRGDPFAGNHDLTIYSYDDRKQLFGVVNTWSAFWGMAGYGTIPYEYVTDPSLAWDAWTLRSESH